MENYDTPEVIMITAWLDTMSERQGWAVFGRWLWRRLIHGQRYADRWLVGEAMIGLAEWQMITTPDDHE